MALWCRNLPTVPARRDAEPVPVTVIIPYYENAGFFRVQADVWREWSDRVRPWVRVIVVDDGSPVPAVKPVRIPVPVSLYRIGVDVRWNWLAARNIGAFHAGPGWLLLTDMDHVVTSELLEAVIFGGLDSSALYAFGRREFTGERVHPHSASWALTRDLFWKIGGYDETLSGHYGTDGDWRRRAAAVGPMRILDADLVRYEYVRDSSTTRYARKAPEDAGVAALIKARRPGWSPRVLSFPYVEVAG